MKALRDSGDFSFRMAGSKIMIFMMRLTRKSRPSVGIQVTPRQICPEEYTLGCRIGVRIAAVGALNG
jgi:hypothetical protein